MNEDLNERENQSFEELKCGVGGQQGVLRQPQLAGAAAVAAAAAASVGDDAHCPFERQTGPSRWSCC